MTRRIAIIGNGHISALAVLALSQAGMHVELGEAEPKQQLPAIKDRDIRGPDLNRPQNPWSGERRRAQWKDEQQRRGRQR